ncbi:8-oxo-dGTP diphosphatase [Solibacillus kalamii]|uniref:DNA mismatch repair protein MutT n=1 Tax=Solibacillus kalamii TaxID=1748298 RepID=A0ABX3ZLM9_9BACL|nr:8-oxo-dGTP diphosphatase [Solibacillus kalamii]MBM7664993.1 8-oxo-dGTP diphosphatase [Solibacillus kalamii]OUZ40645.1 DNA mismatch repair protein MutT [Solibacillus kalamii]
MNYKFWTVVMIQKEDRVLLLNRQHDHFKGYIPPGGKVDFPEGFAEGAIREVKEETGLDVQSLAFKGISHYTNPELHDHFIIYNYWTDHFTGEVLGSCNEGELEWVKISEAKNYPMQEDIQVRFDLFFEPGTFEIHTMWDERNNQIDKRIIHKL